MVTKAKKALLASLAAFLCVMLTVFGLSMSVSLSETAKAADETTTEVAEVNGVKFATLAEAIAAAKDGETVKLLADATEDVVVDKNITLDLGGKTLTGTNSGYATLSIQNGATTTVKNGSIVGSTSYYTIEITKGSNATATFEDLTATAGNTGSSMIDNWGTLTITSGTYFGGLNVVKSEEGSTLVINGGKFTLNYSTNGYTGVILVYGDTTINGGEFIQSLTSCGRWDHPQVIATGVVEGYTATTKVTGGSFTNLCSGEGIFRGIGKATSDNFEVSGGTFNKSISEGFCADGFKVVKNSDGTYSANTVEVWTGFNESLKVSSHASIEDAMVAASQMEITSSQFRRVVVKGNYELKSDITIGTGLYLDVLGTLTIKKGATLTVAEDCKRLSAWYGGTIVNNGTVLLCAKFINNGTFEGNSFVVPEGYVLSKNNNNILPIREDSADLKIEYDDGSTYYFNNDGYPYATTFGSVKATKITLLKDRYKAIGIDVEAEVELDLNGHTLRSEGAASLTVSKDNTYLKIVNSANAAGKIVAGSVDSGNNKPALWITSGTAEVASNVILDGGSNQPAVYLTGGNLVLYGTATTTGDYAITTQGTNTSDTKITIKDRATVSAENGLAIYNPKGTLIVEGGEISGKTGVQVSSGKFEISGGTITATGADESAGCTNAITDGAAVSIINRNYPAGIPSATIEGGTFISSTKPAVRAYDWTDNAYAAWTEAGEYVNVKGGTFSSVPDNIESLCAEGHILTNNADGTYGVKVGVAEVNGVKYETLQAAIAAAARNATVKLLADTRENVTIAKALTLDLNGHTINGGTVNGKPAVTVTARVTIQDSSEKKTGTIMREDTADNSGVSSHYVIDVQGAGWLTFEGGKVINNSGNDEGNGASLVRVGNDSVAKYPGLNIKGGTFTQDNFIVIKIYRGDLFLNGGTLNSANSYAIENRHRATVKGGTVNGDVVAWTYSGGLNSTLTISNGTINGDVESVSYDGAAGKLAKVSITGGTVTGTLSNKVYNKPGDADKAIATIEVSGGTFKENPSKYLVEDSAIINNADGTFGVKKAEKVYLAKVGETSYYTMDEAFHAAVATGGTLVLLRDYTTSSVQNSGSNSFTIDLNGHTWTYTGTDMNDAAFEINYPNVTLTVKNGTIISNTLVGLIPSAMGGTIKYDNAGLVFEKVEMTSNGRSGIETNGNNTNDSVTLKNSTLNVPNGFGIYFPSSGTLTIDNSTITAKTMGVQVCSGMLNINAGSVITVTGDAVTKTENDGAIQDGAAISIVNRPGYKGLSNIVITGGTFTANAGKALKAYNWANLTESAFTLAEKVAVSGGAFTSAVPAEYCADGFIPTQNEDGTFGVKAAYVAEVDGVKYETLQAAIDKATKGATVKLLADTKENVTIAKALTLDLNGFTLNGGKGTAKAAITNKGTLTIKDSSAKKTGTIKREDSGIVGETSYYVIRNLGTMTIEQANVINNSGYRKTNPSGSMIGSSLICNGDNDEGASLTINGGKLTQLNFLAVKNGANGTLVVNGGEITSNHSAIQNWFNAELTGGTIRGQLWTAAWKKGESVGNTVISGNVDYEGEIVMDVTGSTKPELKVNGGNLSVTNWIITTACAESGGKPAVSGGTFTNAVPAEYCAQDFRPAKNGDLYTVASKYIYSATVTLGEDISFKYKLVSGVTFDKIEVSYYKVNATEPTVYTYTIDDLITEGTDRYCILNGITPQMIDRKISVTVYAEGKTKTIYDVTDYSILDYLQKVLDRKNEAKTEQLVASLAYYGQAAMEYVHYNTGTVNKFIKDNNLQQLKSTITGVATDEVSEGMEKVARITVAFESLNRILVAVKKDYFESNKYTITVNGVAVDASEWKTDVIDGYYVYETNGVAASYITAEEHSVTVVVKDGDTPVQTVKYNVAGYCFKMQNHARMGKLAKATYYYGVAAAEYAAA